MLLRGISTGISLKFALPAGISCRRSEFDTENPSERQEGTGTTSTIRSLLKEISEDRIRNYLFTLAKDPFPYRKLNYTRPGQTKSTLHEVDDWIEAQLRGWGYAVERETCPVQAFACDRAKPLHHWYAPPPS